VLIWVPRHPDEVEEREEHLVRHAIEPVQELVGHEREGLDERDAWVVDVVVGPFGTTLLDQSLPIVHEVLEPTVVEVRHRYPHHAPRFSSAPSWDGMT